MSKFDYARSVATAKRLIDRFGGPVTLTRTAVTGAVSVLNTIGVKVSTVGHALEGSGVQIGDDIVYLDASIAPEPGDRIAYADESRVVVDPVTELKPADVLVYYQCSARRG